MAKNPDNIVTHGISGTLYNLTFVNSKAYGPHLRRKRGSDKSPSAWEYNSNCRRDRNPAEMQRCDQRVEKTSDYPQRLLLPGALLVTIGAELFAPLMFIDFAFPTFL